jgi:hypothetical protein
MISLSYEESDARSGVIDCAPNCKWRSLTAYIQYEYGYCTSTSTILVGTVLGSEVHDGVGDPLCIAASAVPRWPADSFNDTLCVTLNVAVCIATSTIPCWPLDPSVTTFVDLAWRRRGVPHVSRYFP